MTVQAKSDDYFLIMVRVMMIVVMMILVMMILEIMVKIRLIIITTRAPLLQEKVALASAKLRPTVLRG